MASTTTFSTLLARRRISAVYFFIFIVLGLSNGIVGPTLPSLARQTGSTLSQISLLFSAQSLGYLLGSAGSGRFFDRWPAHPLLMGMMLLLAAALITAPFVNLLFLLITVFFVIGLAQSTVDVGGNALLVWVHGNQVGPYMNALHFFFGVGAFLSPLLFVALLNHAHGTAWAYIILALLLIPAVLLLRPLPSPQNPSASRPGVESRAQNHLALLISLLFFLFVGAEMSYAGWIYTYALRQGVADAITAGYLTSLFWGALTLGRLLAIPLARKLPPARMLMLDIGGQMLAIGLLLVAGGRGPVVWIASFGFGISIASVFPTLMSLAERHMPIHGRTTSWFLVAASVGVMIMPWSIGQLFERTGPQGLAWMLAIALFLAAVVFSRFQFAVRETPQS